jgi:hypothetical protein
LWTRALTLTCGLVAVAARAGSSSAGASSRSSFFERAISLSIDGSQLFGKYPIACAPPATASHVSARTVSADGSSFGSLQSMWRTSTHWNVGFPRASDTSSRCASKTSPKLS